MCTLVVDSRWSFARRPWRLRAPSDSNFQAPSVLYSVDIPRVALRFVSGDQSGPLLSHFGSRHQLRTQVLSSPCRPRAPLASLTACAQDQNACPSDRLALTVSILSPVLATCNLISRHPA